ncbi:MAG: alpha-L-fucosidase [Bacteroidales bacterium]|nr:alpha-L-fucosidase [Bacteroidales bacterium]
MKKLLIPLLIFAMQSAVSQTGYQPAAENLANRNWFQDARFGMFIHWGVYAVLGDGEWVMNVQKIDRATYEKLPAFFNPTAFDPAEWVSLAKSAGMKYIVITSKHHDGFAMFDSKLTDWDIADRTPYKRDVLKMLAEECRKQDMKLFFYHSQLDWYQNDYYPRGNTGHSSGRPDSGNWNAYIEYMNGQLTELLTNYGEIAGIWFDGWWDKPEADWQLDKTYSLIHRLQPACLIGSNHHRAPMPGEDFQMFEKDLPGFNTTGFSGESEIGALPLETCETMNRSWGFNLQDKEYKTVTELIQYLVKAAGYNSNFLLNVGPMPNGKIQPEFIDTLKVLGQWMNQFGETIYGTRQGPVKPCSWGVSTQKGNRIFLHVLKSDEQQVVMPRPDEKITAVQLFHNKERVDYTLTRTELTISIPSGIQHMPDLVIEIVRKTK